tara:strand:- start:1069 stop:1788 length:720 start_codon:yes stop_codon:yes gene_type:complete
MVNDNRTSKTYGNNWIWILLAIVVVAGVGVGLAIGLKKDNNTVSSSLNGFDVEYQNSSLVSKFGNNIKAAAEFWNNILNEPNNIRIEVREVSDTPTTLALARPFSSTDLKGGGIIYFNTNANYHDWDFVTKHEMGHIFGIGSNVKWDDNIYYSGGQYFLSSSGFPETYQIYTNQFSGTESGTPIGDARGHFDEDVFDRELMTPIAEVEGINQPVTLLTLTALKELGWNNIDLTQAQPYN